MLLVQNDITQLNTQTVNHLNVHAGQMFGPQLCVVRAAVILAKLWALKPDSAQVLVPLNKEHHSHYIKSQIPLPHIISNEERQHHTTTKATVPLS